MGAPIRVGTSGWIYPHWRGRFYPADLAPSRWLEFLSRRLPSVEVNATFYSLTTPRACDRWRAAVPPGFLFALKGSRYITHMKRLRDARAALANFFASGILRLGDYLGPILWQLPPSLAFRSDVAGRFFATLPRDLREAERLARRHDRRVSGRAALTAPDGHGVALRHALEPRHPSWLSDEALALLRANEIAIAWSDSAGVHPSASVSTSKHLAYVRLHGARRIYEGTYTDEELDLWTRRAAGWVRHGTPVFVYFDNDRDAAAAHDAVRMLARVQRRPTNLPAVARPAMERNAPPRERPAHFAFRRRLR